MEAHHALGVWLPSSKSLWPQGVAPTGIVFRPDLLINCINITPAPADQEKNPEHDGEREGDVCSCVWECEHDVEPGVQRDGDEQRLAALGRLAEEPGEDDPYRVEDGEGQDDVPE